MTPPNKTGLAWSKADDALLAEICRTMPITQVGQRMGRSVPSVLSRLAKVVFCERKKAKAMLPINETANGVRDIKSVPGGTVTTHRMR